MSEVKSEAICRLLSAKAVLLDYDGLLVDTEAIYFETWSSILDERGKRLCATFHHGKHESEVFAFLKDHISANLNTLEEVSAYREKAFYELVEKQGMEVMPGWLSLLAFLQPLVPLFVVSNSTISDVVWGLKNVGIHDCMSGIIGYSSGAKRKPDPFLYNEAVRQIEIPTSELIAFEDSHSGLLAAQAAGIYVICISNTIETPVISNDCEIPCFRSAFEILKMMDQ